MAPPIGAAAAPLAPGPIAPIARPVCVLPRSIDGLHLGRAGAEKMADEVWNIIGGAVTK